MTPPARVGRIAFLLGFAGLLPQAAAVLELATNQNRDWLDAAVGGAVTGAAQVYAALILSFLGGMWWGFAMRRERGQGWLVAAAVVPSLVAFAILLRGELEWSGNSVLIGLGVAILLTLPVDWRLVRTGEAPANWMKLRVPLSVGLGGLTIAAGVLSR